MPYSDFDESIQESAPYYLYQFTSEGVDYLFTNTVNDLNVNALDWIGGTSILHTEPKQSNEMSKNNIKVTMDRETTLGALFTNYPPDFRTSFNLFRGQFGTAETRIMWKGRVNSHKFDKGRIIFDCESIMSSIRQAGLTERWQRNCQHTIYGPGCNVDKSLHGQFDMAVTSVVLEQSRVQSPGFDVQPAGYWVGGFVTFPDGSSRMVKEHVSINSAQSYVILDSLPRYAAERTGGGFVVSVYRPCDKTRETCKNVFNNILNNGSITTIPKRNPMGGSSII